MQNYIRVKRLHCSIPEELFSELQKYGLLKDIDNIVAELLSQRVDEIKRIPGGWDR